MVKDQRPAEAKSPGIRSEPRNLFWNLVCLFLVIAVAMAIATEIKYMNHSVTVDKSFASFATSVEEDQPEPYFNSVTASKVEKRLKPKAVPIKTSFTSGEVVGSINIPKISANFTLLEMANVDDQPPLDRAPSHVGGTALPGKAGNCVIAGHRSTFTHPFLRLGELVPGDVVILVDLQGTRFFYRVDRIFVVNPTEVWVMNPTPGPTLTLVTCHPINSSRYRLIVKGSLVFSGNGIHHLALERSIN
jgi:LPXTG-site transpeptidase (sortase) family protein